MSFKRIEQETAPLQERPSPEHCALDTLASLESTLRTGINVAEASLPRRCPLQTCTPRTPPISAIRFPDALSSREDGLPASSEFSEDQPQD